MFLSRQNFLKILIRCLLVALVIICFYNLIFVYSGNNDTNEVEKSSRFQENIFYPESLPLKNQNEDIQEKNRETLDNVLEIKPIEIQLQKESINYNVSSITVEKKDNYTLDVLREDKQPEQNLQENINQNDLNSLMEELNEEEKEMDTVSEDRDKTNGIKLEDDDKWKSDPEQALRRRQQLLKCINSPLVFERHQQGQFWVIKNLIRGTESVNIGCAESITYTTNGDYTFFNNLPTVVSRWLAPVSFAIFAPGFDMNLTMSSIQYVRNCIEESELIRKYVSFHVFFPNNHMPKKVPLNEEEAIAVPYDCTVEVPPYENIDLKDTYKTQANLTYPINVARNIARKAANTYFIFACDIELFPNVGFVEKFLDLVDRNSTEILNTKKPRVFPMPVFEIESNATIPDTKGELIEMLNTKMAIPFHSKVCKECHLVPKQNEWLLFNDSDQMSLFTIGKRMNKFRYWEPFYISDNREPLFDERVTWEGQSNKRIQNLAMCLLDYEYYVLHPAFLVHSPGIKVFQKTNRLKYVSEMNKIIKHQIDPEYRILFGNNSKCSV